MMHVDYNSYGGENTDSCSSTKSEEKIEEKIEQKTEEKLERKSSDDEDCLYFNSEVSDR